MISGVNGVTKNNRIRIERPEILNPEEERLWKDVLKYAKLIPSEPEPNMGRIQEIKEEIDQGTYLTLDKIQETAARLTIRFLKKD